MKANKATITITLPPMDVSEITAQVVEHLARQTEKEVKEIIGAMVKARFDEGVKKAADNAVHEFLNRQIPKTNTYGERTGGATTITEYVIELFNKHMQERVQSDGRRADSYNDKAPTRHQWLLDTIGTQEIVKVAKAEIEKVRKSAEAQVSAAVGNFIAQNLVAPVTAHMIK